MIAADATIYERLRERSPIRARLWAIAETSRLIFATLALCGPWIILVHIAFDALRQSVDELLQLLSEWQPYAFTLGVAAVSFLFWQTAGWIARRLARIVEEPGSE
jgi:hypothetical protein